MNLTSSIIKHYQQLSNEQLLDLYENEIDRLTPNARTILIEEIKKRNIPPELWQNKQIRETFRFDADVDLYKKLMIFYESGWNKEDLKAYLLLQGFSVEDSENILEKIGKKIYSRAEQAITIITNGILFLVMGAAVLVLPLDSGKHKAIILLAYSSAIFGMIRALHGFYIKRKSTEIRNRWNTSVDKSELFPTPSGEE